MESCRKEGNEYVVLDFDLSIWEGFSIYKSEQDSSGNFGGSIENSDLK
jgi:hypothetical protein